MRSIVSVQDLAGLIFKSSVVLVDARGGAEAHKNHLSCHLPDALFVDLETELSFKSPDPSNGGRHPLPSPQKFAEVLTGLGIGADSTVVVYDDRSGANAAARFWWMMKSIGHTKVQVLDGGIDAWIRAGFQTQSGQVLRVPALEPYLPVNSEKVWALPLVGIDIVDAARLSPEHSVIDVREEFRYLGEREPIDLIAGHIPRAINIPYVENLSADGTFLEPALLERRFASVFAKHQSENVIVHCGSGVTACHTLLAMEIAGFCGAKLYVGSWSEWSRNPRPMATGR